MTLNNGMETPLKGIQLQGTPQVQDHRQIIHRAVWLKLIQKPQADRWAKDKWKGIHLVPSLASGDGTGAAASRGIAVSNFVDKICHELSLLDNAFCTVLIAELLNLSEQLSKRLVL